MSTAEERDEPAPDIVSPPVLAPADAPPRREAAEGLRAVIEREARAVVRRRIRIALLALGLAGAAIGAFAYFRPGAPKPAELYRVGTVDRGAVVREVRATGRVEARSTVDVGAQVSGRIATVEVDFDEVVEQGQLLATFDRESLEAQERQARANLRLARASLKQARAELKDATRNLARSKKLHARGIETDERLESAESAVVAAKARVESSLAQIEVQRANLALSDTNLGYTAVRSPIAGIVIARRIDPGQTVAATFQTPTLFQIAEDLTKMRVMAAIDEADVGAVVVGQPASFTVDAFPDRVFRASVTELRSAPTVTQNVVTYEAVLDVANPDRSLKPGMTASVRIEVAAEADTLRVPNAALRFVPPGVEDQDPGHGVWILDEEVPRRVPVSPGIGNGTHTSLKDAGELAEGTEVLVDLSARGREMLEPDA